MGKAILLEDLVLLLALFDILAYLVVPSFLRARQIRRTGLHDINAYAPGFYFADIVLVLDLVTNDDIGRLEFAAGKGFYDLSFYVFVVHICFRKKARISEITNRVCKPITISHLPVLTQVNGTYFSSLLKVCRLVCKGICLIISVCPPV